MKGSAVALGAAGLLCAAVVLCGCSSGESPGAPAGSARPAPAAPRKPQPAAGLVSPDMVGAAATGSGSAAVQVKFELKGRPAVAQPLDIDLAIVPSTGSFDRISGRVEVGEGLELAAGREIPPTDRPVQGVPILHSIRVLPKKDGIFTVNAVLSLESATQTSSQTFSIPVIVGSGLKEPAKPSTTVSNKPPSPAR